MLMHIQATAGGSSLFAMDFTIMLIAVGLFTNNYHGLAIYFIAPKTFLYKELFFGVQRPSQGLEH